MRALNVKNTKFTARQSDIVSLYFNDVNKYPVLTIEEEENLAFIAKEGDRKAIDKLVESNLRIVITVANRYVNSGVPQNDLISSGNIGLIKAAESFDPTRGTKFITYAVWHIRAAIQEEILKNKNLVYVPGNTINELSSVWRFIASYEAEKGISPSTTEIARGMGISEKKVENLLALPHGYISMDAPMQKNSDYTFGDCLASESNTDASLESSSKHSILNQALASFLPEREAQILEMFFGLNGHHAHTLTEIGHEMNLSTERVRQLKEKALTSLRKSNLLKNI